MVGPRGGKGIRPLSASPTWFIIPLQPYKCPKLRPTSLLSERGAMQIFHSNTLTLGPGIRLARKTICVLYSSERPDIGHQCSAQTWPQQLAEALPFECPTGKSEPLLPTASDLQLFLLQSTRWKINSEIMPLVKCGSDLRRCHQTLAAFNGCQIIS